MEESVAGAHFSCSLIVNNALQLPLSNMSNVRLKIGALSHSELFLFVCLRSLFDEFILVRLSAGCLNYTNLFYTHIQRHEMRKIYGIRVKEMKCSIELCEWENGGEHQTK